jgi:ABC-type uncharacterized transport system substrate-binding protein
MNKYFLFALLLSLTAVVPVIAQGQEKASVRQGPFRILHIMSYHQPWAWTESQFAGFRQGLLGVDIEYRVFEMDTKRHSDPEWKDEAGRRARKLIDDWRPDLIYTNDDNAQKYVTSHYLDANLPFVFSGVNAEPESYGFDKSKNVTGVLEHEHFVQTIKLLRGIVPEVRRIVVISDDGPTWPAVIKRMQAKLSEISDLEVVAWEQIKTFEEYKQKILAYQDKVDAVGLLGVFTFKDEEGKNVPYSSVMRWTVENSSLPDFSFWGNRIGVGTLCAVAVSGHAQGLQAGKLAREILMNNTSPDQLPMMPTRMGEPILNLRRAQELRINIQSSVLLSAKVITGFEWEQR